MDQKLIDECRIKSEKYYGRARFYRVGVWTFLIASMALIFIRHDENDLLPLFFLIGAVALDMARHWNMSKATAYDNQIRRERSRKFYERAKKEFPQFIVTMSEDGVVHIMDKKLAEQEGYYNGEKR